MITLHYLQEKSIEYTKPANDLLYEDRAKLVERIKQLSNGFVSLYDDERYEIKTIEVDEKCKCDNYMQTTMILILKKSDGQIEMIGSDNYINIHRKVGVHIDKGIEYYSGGAYQLMSDKYFNANYVIKQTIK